MPSTKYMDMSIQCEPIQRAWKPDVGHKVWCAKNNKIFTLGSTEVCCNSTLGEGYKQYHFLIPQLWQLYDICYEVCGFGWVKTDEECIKFFLTVEQAINQRSVSGKNVPNISKEEAMICVLMATAFGMVWNGQDKKWVEFKKKVIEVVH